MATGHAENATDRLLETLEERVEELAEEALRAMADEIPAYAAHTEDAFHDDVREHALAHYRTILRSFSERRPVEPEDLLFVRRHAGRRVGQVSLADFLHAFRVGQLVLWDAALELAVDDHSRRVVLELVTHVVNYVNVASTHAGEVYVETERTAHAEAERVRRDLLEELIAGHPPAPARASTPHARPGWSPRRAAW